MTVNITDKDIEAMAHVQNRVYEKFDGKTLKRNCDDIGPNDVSPMMIQHEMLLAYKEFEYVYENDILNGSAEIAKYLGWTKAKVLHAIAGNKIPYGRIGKRSIIASKMTLRIHLEQIAAGISA